MGPADRQRGGWLRLLAGYGAVLGAAAGLVAVLAVLVISGRPAVELIGGRVSTPPVAILTVAMLAGVAPGLLVGAAVQLGSARMLRRARRPAAGERGGRRPGGGGQVSGRAGEVPAHRRPGPGPAALPAGSEWDTRYRSCVAEVARFRAAAGSVAAGPVRNWLDRLGAELDMQLGEVHRLAVLGASVARRAETTGPPGAPDRGAPDRAGPDAAIRSLRNRIRFAEEGLRSATARAAGVAAAGGTGESGASAGPGPNRPGVLATQLDLLGRELPRMRPATTRSPAGLPTDAR
jgi:hypothetical protein